MNKNTDKIILLISLLILILGIATVSASEMNPEDYGEVDDIDSNSQDINIQDTSMPMDTQDNLKTRQETTSINKESKNIKKATYSVDETNIGRYFDLGDGSTTKNVKENDTILLSGTFKDVEFYIDKVGLKVIGNNAKLTGGQIIISDEAGNNLLSNITITTTDYDNAILNLAENTNITNNKVTLKNADGVTEGIRNEAKNVIISNNIVNVEGPSKNINFDDAERKNMAFTFGIVNQANNTLIENNTVTAKKHKDAVDEFTGTIDAIEVQGYPEEIISNVTIKNNNVHVSDARFVYGINVLNSIDNIKVLDNNITATSIRYSNGIQLGDKATNCLIQNNKVDARIINATPDEDTVSFGIIATNTVASGTENITIKDNDVKIDAQIGYAFEIYNVHNSNIYSNTMNVSGEYAMGIGLSGSKNSNITNNEMTLNGNSARNSTLAEYIPPSNNGIHIQEASDNIIVKDNKVRVTDRNNNSKAVYIRNCDNVNVFNNDLVADNLYGDNAVVSTNSSKTTIKNNTSPFDKKDAIITIQAPKKVDTGKTIKINLTITDTAKKAVNGTAVIKINGLSIKDINTQTSAITIKNGKGTLTMTLASYSGKEYTVTAIFSKTGFNRAENSTKMTVNKGTYKTFTIKLNGTSEQKIRIKQTLTDTNGNKIYGNTQVAIKLGDRTVKTLTVSNSILDTEIIVPYLPPGENKFKITLGENYRYNTKIINSTINISKQDVVVKINSIKATPGKTVNLTATLTNKNTKTPVISGKYVFKVNGKTVPIVTEFFEEIYTTKNITKGLAKWEYTIPNYMNPGVYDITLNYNGNTQSNPVKYSSKSLTIS